MRKKKDSNQKLQEGQPDNTELNLKTKMNIKLWKEIEALISL